MRRDILRTVLAVGVLWVVVGRGMAADWSRPVVGVRFVITSRDYVEPLQARKAGLEALVAREIAGLCAAELSYLEWRALTNAASAGDPAWVLQATMVSEGSSQFPPVHLEFEGMDPAGGVRMRLREPLYTANLPDQPYQEETRLRDDLLGKVRSFFGNSQNLALIQSRYLVAVPVARSLAAIPERKRVLLPARWGDLLPGDRSELRALYEVPQQDGSKAQVKVLLAPSVALRDRVSCKVTHFDDGFVDEPAWHPAMPLSLSQAIPDSVRVFMDRYVKDYNYTPTLDEGVVMEPSGVSGVGGGP